MGTRADFYVGRGEKAEWIGSIAWDGYPEGITEPLKAADSELSYRTKVAKRLAAGDDATTPDHGWPWPWENSHTTDWTYAFDDGSVYASNFGRNWFKVAGAVPDDDGEWPSGEHIAVFPNMGKNASALPGSARSGIIVVTARR